MSILVISLIASTLVSWHPHITITAIDTTVEPNIVFIDIPYRNDMMLNISCVDDRERTHWMSSEFAEMTYACNNDVTFRCNIMPNEANHMITCWSARLDYGLFVGHMLLMSIIYCMGYMTYVKVYEIRNIKIATIILAIILAIAIVIYLVVSYKLPYLSSVIFNALFIVLLCVPVILFHSVKYVHGIYRTSFHKLNEETGASNV